MDKIVRIDMGAKGSPKITTEPVGEYAGLGGRATTSMIINNGGFHGHVSLHRLRHHGSARDFQALLDMLQWFLWYRDDCRRVK